MENLANTPLDMCGACVKLSSQPCAVCVIGLLLAFLAFLPHTQTRFSWSVCSVLYKQGPFVGVQLISPSLGQGADVLSQGFSLPFAPGVTEHMVCAIPAW